MSTRSFIDVNTKIRTHIVPVSTAVPACTAVQAGWRLKKTPGKEKRLPRRRHEPLVIRACTAVVTRSTLVTWSPVVLIIPCC